MAMKEPTLKFLYWVATQLPMYVGQGTGWVGVMLPYRYPLAHRLTALLRCGLCLSFTRIGQGGTRSAPNPPVTPNSGRNQPICLDSSVVGIAHHSQSALQLFPPRVLDLHLKLPLLLGFGDQSL